MNIKELKIDDDFKNLLPPLPEESYKALESDIIVNGLYSSIVTWNGFIADGHNRYSICMKHGITDVPTKPLILPTKADVMQWIVDNQFAKRNLLFSEKIRLLSKVHEQYEKQAKERQLSAQNNNAGKAVLVNLPKQEEPLHVSEKMADKVGVSEKTYRDAKFVVEEGTEEQIERMDRGGKGNGVSAIAREIRAEKLSEEPTKMCPTCKRVLPISMFHLRSRSKDGHDCYCRDCERARMKKKYADHVDKTGKILNAIESVKNDSVALPAETYEDTLAVMKSITDTFVSAFNYNFNKIVFDSDDKIQAVRTLIHSIEPRLGVTAE